MEYFSHMGQYTTWSRFLRSHIEKMGKEIGESSENY